jgi:hypothetical protein
MNVEEIVSQPAIIVPPDSWPVPTGENTPEFEATIEPWIVERATRDLEQPWPRIFPGL